MIILDKPYVSEFLKETIVKNNYPVVLGSDKAELNIDGEINCLSEAEAAAIVAEKDFPGIYSNSENSINWIDKHLTNSKLPEVINLFKDKIKFREYLSSSYPGFFFQSIDRSQLKSFDPSQLVFPIILKPAVGFFSMGVYKITDIAKWNNVVAKIDNELELVDKLYPPVVLNSNKFIIEEFVEGEEYAFDAYYDNDGRPVILNIFKHLFSHDSDVGDRVYISSAEIIRSKKESFTKFLEVLAEKDELKNFPLHVEVRINENDTLFPIEINPMRFGGWCTTADSTYFSYGLNSIEYFFEQKKPNWDKILSKKEDKIYSIIVLDNSTGYASNLIKSFDYDKLKNKFENVLELRKMNVTKANVFGFLFCETPKNNFAELETILKSDLREFVEI